MNELEQYDWNAIVNDFQDALYEANIERMNEQIVSESEIIRP